jgi:hypothetical protein
MTTRLLLVVALIIALSGCSSRRDLEWERVVPAADCHCADGSRFGFWERRADPHRVVFFLNGGGVCWDATTCAFTGEHGENDYYDWGNNAADPENRHGMFDVTRADNPFADYSFIYVSACTGDAHLGNASQEYAPGLTVEHRGYVNGTAALDHLAAHYPDASQVVVVGKTAGSVAAPLYGGLVADRLPDAEVVVLGAQSGAWPDNPQFNADILDARWGAYAAAPRWAVDGLPVRGWGGAALLDPGRPAPSGAGAGPVRLRVRPARGVGGDPVDGRQPAGPPRRDQRQRDGDRGDGRAPAQLHRTGR